MKSLIILRGYDMIIVYEFDLLVIFLFNYLFIFFFRKNTTSHLSETLIGILCFMSSD